MVRLAIAWNGSGTKTTAKYFVSVCFPWWWTLNFARTGFLRLNALVLILPSVMNTITLPVAGHDVVLRVADHVDEVRMDTIL